MPPKRKSGKPKRQTGRGALDARYAKMGVPHGFKLVHPQYGTGFFDFVKKAFNWVKDNKLISTIAKVIPHPIAQTVGGVAGQLGLGRGRRRGARNVLIM